MPSVQYFEIPANNIERALVSIYTFEWNKQKWETPMIRHRNIGYHILSNGEKIYLDYMNPNENISIFSFIQY